MARCEDCSLDYIIFEWSFTLLSVLALGDCGVDGEGNEGSIKSPCSGISSVLGGGWLRPSRLTLLSSMIQGVKFKEQNKVQWNLDLVTDLVTQKSVTKLRVVTKSMYFMY